MADDIVKITNQPPAPVLTVTSSGESVSVGIVQGDLNVTQEIKKELKSHTAEWAQLNTQRYNLFVLQDESYSSGSFSITAVDALKHTKPNLKKQFSSLGSELLRMPCIFAGRNPNYKTAPNYVVAHVGKLTEIIPQGDHIKFCFDKYEQFKQQLINADMRRFNLLENELRNQLDEVHWSVVEGNLLEIIDKLGIEIK